MNIRVMALRELLLLDPFLTATCLWIGDQQVRGVGLSNKVDEPDITMRNERREAVAAFEDQRVKLDLDSMRFTATDLDGKVWTLAFSATQPLAEVAPA